MKTKLFILIIFSLKVCMAMPQADNLINTTKDTTTKWGCSVAINSVEAQIGDSEHGSWSYAYTNYMTVSDKTNKSFSLSIVPKYCINKNILLRFEFGITDINLSSYYNSKSSSSNISYTTYNRTIQQKIYRFIPSLQWMFMKKKIIESYSGICGSYLNYTDMTYVNHVESRDLPSNSLVTLIDEKAIARGGFAIGVGAYTGFNIYFQKHISAGAEFSMYLLDYKIGGAFNGTSTFQNIPSTPVVDEYSISTGLYKGIQFSKVLSSFNISVWF